MVFVTRYLDLVTNFVSVYNTVMKVDPAPIISLFYALFYVFESILKVFFIVSAAATVYLMYVKFRATYDGNHDSFRVEFLLAPVAILAMVLNNDFTVMEILWTFSIYLESVAILPQLFMVSKTGEAETITSHYLFALGSYRALYILNWIYRYHFEGTYDVIAIVAGCVQTVLYCDFFYLYITKVMKGKSLVLPA